MEESDLEFDPWELRGSKWLWHQMRELKLMDFLRRSVDEVELRARAGNPAALEIVRMVDVYMYCPTRGERERVQAFANIYLQSLRN